MKSALARIDATAWITALARLEGYDEMVGITGSVDRACRDWLTALPSTNRTGRRLPRISVVKSSPNPVSSWNLAGASMQAWD